MPNRDVLVLCGGCRGDPRRDERVLALHLDGADGPSKVNLGLQNLARAMLRPIPAPLADLVEVACYVFSADQFTTRDTPEMHHLGAGWRRNFRFRIPVRDTATWQRSDVLEQLTSTLAFLSEDAYAFEFERGDRPEGLEPYFGFNEEEASSLPQGSGSSSRR